MWSKYPPVVWFSLKAGSSRGFCIPIPSYIFLELLDCVLDLTSLLCVFVPKQQVYKGNVSLHSVKELLESLEYFIGSLSENEPYELVDVAADKVRVSIKIR